MAQLATELNVHRNTARRWLLELDRKSGGRVVMRSTASTRAPRHRAKLWTTRSRILAADRSWFEERELRVDRQEKSEKEIADLKNELRRVKRLMREAIDELKRVRDLHQSAPICTTADPHR